MEMNMAKFSEKLHELVEMGKKKKNVLEYKEINEVLKDMELDSDAMDKLYEYLEAYGIDVLRIPEGDSDDTFLLSDDDEVNLRRRRRSGYGKYRLVCSGRCQH